MLSAILVLWCILALRYNLLLASAENTVPLTYDDSKEKFFNDGRLKGWSAKHIEASGTISEISNNCFVNKVDKVPERHCLKFTQDYDPEYRGRYHDELIINEATKIGETDYYGFAFKLSPSWEFDESYRSGDKVDLNRVLICRFVTSFSDKEECGENMKIYGVPGTAFWIQNDNLYTKLRWGSPCGDNGDDERRYKIGKVVPGQWHTIIFGAYWSQDKRGWFKVWYDKMLKVDVSNVHTFMQVDKRLFQMRIGLYPNWYIRDEAHPVIKEGLSKHREIYFDKIAFGPSLQDVDPWKSSVGKDKVKFSLIDTETD